MQCPSPKCGSTNVQSLPMYANGLSPDSRGWAEYRQPSAPDTRPRLLLIAVAAVGAVMAATGQPGMGLLVLAAGALGAMVAHRRITDVEAARARWGQSQICLACTERWVP